MNPGPIADFTWTEECEGIATQFTDQSTPDPLGGNIDTWFWDFGDGNTSTLQNPAHTYLTAGTYTVTLTATDVNGCVGYSTQTITVLTLPTTDFTFTEECEGFATVFTDASTNGSGTIDTWFWDFGDGNTSTLQKPAHTYLTAGTYTVTLTDTDDKGSLGYYTQTIR